MGQENIDLIDKKQRHYYTRQHLLGASGTLVNDR